MLRKLGFDLLAINPYDVFAGYFDIIDGSVKNLSLKLLVIASFDSLYYEPIGDTKTYKYRKKLPINCIITANIMMNNKMPYFSKILNVDLCDEIVALCEKYCERSDAELYRTGQFTKRSLRKYVLNYHNFKKQHNNTIRGFVIGRNNKIDNQMVELMNGINLSYYNISDDFSLLSGVIPDEVLKSLNKNSDIVIIDGADVAMK